MAELSGECRDCGLSDRLDGDRRCPYCAELRRLACTLKPRAEPGKTAIRISPSGYWFTADLTRERYYRLPDDDTWIYTPGNGTWAQIAAEDIFRLTPTTHP